MKTQSAKSKGQRGAKQVKEAILKSRPIGEDEVLVTPAGVNGRDLRITNKQDPISRFVFEIKNTEKLNIWDALKQSERHVESESEIPVVAFKRNRSKTYLAIELNKFLELL